MLTSREEYIKKTFFSHISEQEVNELVKKVSAIGESIGYIGQNINQDKDKSDKRKHKYDVWISKEVKKDLSVLNKSLELRLIVDWASDTNSDIFQYNFQEAFNAQQNWHEEMMRKHQIDKINISDIDQNRVIFRFSDKEHFLYLLNLKDLTQEGIMMGNCIGGKNYKSKVKNKQSIIFSIRDKNNMSHVTIEIDVNSKSVVQKYGKGNKMPISKYLRMYEEYALFATGFKDIKNKEFLKFLNLDFRLSEL